MLTDLNTLLPPGSGYNILNGGAITNSGQISAYGQISASGTDIQLILVSEYHPVIFIPGIAGSTLYRWYDWIRILAGLRQPQS